MAKTWSERALAGDCVVVNIGQLSTADVRSLNKLVQEQRLVTWRGYWFPVAGGSHGLGPLKTCWARELI